MTAAVAISLVAGLGVGAWLVADRDAPASAVPATASTNDFVMVSDERLLSLEQLIAEERAARLELAAIVEGLLDDIERRDSATSRSSAEVSAEADANAVERAANFRRSRDFTAMMRNFEARRLSSLVDGGFTEDEARRILQKESEAEYQAMRLAWEAQRNGEPLDPLASRNDPQAILRAELGDSDYERFLEAQGQPTSVQITRVLDGSPGSQAGLQPGDQVVSYDGNRVFNVADLRDQTLLGEQGEDVLLEIDRDGVRMQLSVPRGPVGITGAGANIRTMGRWGGS